MQQVVQVAVHLHAHSEPVLHGPAHCCCAPADAVALKKQAVHSHVPLLKPAPRKPVRRFWHSCERHAQLHSCAGPPQTTAC